MLFVAELWSEVDCPQYLVLLIRQCTAFDILLINVDNNHNVHGISRTVSVTVMDP